MAPLIIDETKSVLKAVRSHHTLIKTAARAGAYIRGIARKSLSTRKNAPPSLPGKPPRSPTGRLKDAIVFAADSKTNSAVIGPSNTRIGEIGSTHEFGGTEGPKPAQRKRGGAFSIRIGGHGPLRMIGTKITGVGKLRTAGQLRRATDNVAALKLKPHVLGVPPTRRVYPARPFMGPALIRSRDRLPAFWKNSVKG